MNTITRITTKIAVRCLLVASIGFSLWYIYKHNDQTNHYNRLCESYKNVGLPVVYKKIDFSK